jgi:hypothetical protein
MIGEFRASLYDVFGYLIPGIAATAGLILVGVSLNEAFATSDTQTVGLSWLSSPPLATLALLACYAVGHLCQAIGNALPALSRPPEDDFLVPDEFPTSVTDRATAVLGSRLGIDASTVNLRVRVALMDQIRGIGGASSDREVFVYREGFYRGLTVAMSAVVLALATRLLFASTSLGFANAQVELDRRGNVLLLLVCAAAVALFRERMRRFGRYRVQQTVLGFLAVATRDATSSRAG